MDSRKNTALIIWKRILLVRLHFNFFYSSNNYTQVTLNYIEFFFRASSVYLPENLSEWKLLEQNKYGK